MNSDLLLEIGGIPVRLRTDDGGLRQALRERYEKYLTATASAEPIDMRLSRAVERFPEWETPRASCTKGLWQFGRTDFRAEWSPDTGSGWIRHVTAAPHTIDAFLRMLYSVLIAGQGGFLVHAASAIRNGKAFVFMGVSGAGKTTMTRLAPPDAAPLTDEVSYIRIHEGRYWAFGTPFFGDWGKAGANLSAPIEAVYQLAQGPANVIEPLAPKDAVRALLRNIMFFSKDPELVRVAFETACRFVGAVPVRRLTFAPTPEVWELIR